MANTQNIDFDFIIVLVRCLFVYLPIFTYCFQLFQS